MDPSPSNPSNDRLQVSTKVAWGTGGMVDNLMMNGMGALILPIYNIALGVNPIWLGYAMLLPRVLDAIIDPLIGNWSDNARTRWGRRRPFIAVGAILTAIACILLWMPPLTLSENGLLTYFTLSFAMLCVGYATFSIPWSALGYELTTDFHERTRVMAWRLYFAYAAGFALPWLYKLSLHPALSPLDTGGVPKEIYGVRWVAAGVALICLAASLVPAIFCRERVPENKQEPIPVWTALRLTFQNRAFVLLSGVMVIVISGLIISGPFLVYLNIYFVAGGDKGLAATLGGWGGMLGQILGLASTPFLVRLATGFGKKATIILGLGVAMGGYLLSWFCITPAMPYLQLLPAFLIYPGLNSVWLLSQSVIADICDIDELSSGRRREGMFGAAITLIFKLSMAIGPVLVGYMLAWSGYHETAAAQMPETLWLMRLFYVAIPSICLLVAIGLTVLLPISEARAREIRRQLDERFS